jgi:hypothetical protein
MLLLVKAFASTWALMAEVACHLGTLSYVITSNFFGPPPFINICKDAFVWQKKSVSTADAAVMTSATARDEHLLARTLAGIRPPLALGCA